MSTSSRWPKPPHVEALLANIDEVDRLIGIHRILTGDAPGRRRNVEVLNKSGLVLVVACWEAFVEDLAQQAFDYLLRHATKPQVFPASVLVLASASLQSSKDSRDVWKLAGEGWRPVLSQHRDLVLARYVGRMNTPRPEQVDLLFEKLIGLKGLSVRWCWKGATAAANQKKLDALVSLRGEIAHRVVASRSVHKAHVMAAGNLIIGLAARSSNVVGDFLASRSGDYPWRPTIYGSVQ